MVAVLTWLLCVPAGSDKAAAPTDVGPHDEVASQIVDVVSHRSGADNSDRTRRVGNRDMPLDKSVSSLSPSSANASGFVCQRGPLVHMFCCPVGRTDTTAVGRKVVPRNDWIARSAEGHRAVARLAAPSSTQWNNMPLRVALTEMSNQAGLRLRLDEIPDADPVFDELITLHTEGIKFSSALSLAVARLGLTWRVDRDGDLVVFRKLANGRARTDRAYDLSRIDADTDDVVALVRLLGSEVDLKVGSEPRTIEVTASEECHERIAIQLDLILKAFGLDPDYVDPAISFAERQRRAELLKHPNFW